MPLDAKLMDRVFESPQLPSLPTIALQIIDMVQQDEVDVDKIAETISLDPALSTKMLKTVNSSFYGLPKTIGSVHQAVVVLGLNSVKTLALGFSLVSNLTAAGGQSFDHMNFWRRSLYSATAAKQLCEWLNIVQAEEVFMASLLQDVGVLALAQVLGREYAPLMLEAKADHRKLAPLEREKLGGDHMEVGAALADTWGLPPLLVESIRLHEDPDEAPENLVQLIRTVAAGGITADLIDDPVDDSRVADYFAIMEAWFGFDQPVADKLLRGVFKHASEAQRLFELPTGELANPDVILEKANEALRRLNAEENKKKLTNLEAEAQASSDVKDADPPTLADADQGPAMQEGALKETSAGATNPRQDESANSPAHEAVPKAPERESEPEPDSPLAPPAAPSDRVDALTGLLNRRSFDEKLDESFVKATHETPLSLLFVDIDSFKAVNDQHGNEAGDSILRQFAELIAGLAGQSGDVFRFNEDEFTVVCPGMSRHDAALLGEQLRAEIEGKRFAATGDASGEGARLTVSIGVATYEGVLFKRSDQLVKAASKGVFAAKHGGCNIVRVFVPRTSNANNEAA